jgi:hypothetical protein
MFDVGLHGAVESHNGAGGARSDPSAPFDTTEVRWFAAGPLPDALVQWFAASGEPTLVETRRDAYLAAGSHGVGQKRRNYGPFEVKRRLRYGEFVHLSDALTGRLEEWRKLVEIQPVPTAGDRWADVNKVVLTRTYRLRSDGQVVRARERDISVPGCDIELASVSVAGIDAWTFAFEAWGPSDRRRDVLDQAADLFIVASGLPAELTSHLSADMGYPEWLAGVVWADPGSRARNPDAMERRTPTAPAATTTPPADRR